MGCGFASEGGGVLGVASLLEGGVLGVTSLLEGEEFRVWLHFWRGGVWVCSCVQNIGKEVLYIKFFNQCQKKLLL